MYGASSVPSVQSAAILFRSASKRLRAGVWLLCATAGGGPTCADGSSSRENSPVPWGFRASPTG